MVFEPFEYDLVHVRSMVHCSAGGASMSRPTLGVTVPSQEARAQSYKAL